MVRIKLVVARVMRRARICDGIEPIDPFTTGSIKILMRLIWRRLVVLMVRMRMYSGSARRAELPVVFITVCLG